jgi:hypothetical protein
MKATLEKLELPPPADALVAALVVTELTELTELWRRESMSASEN